VCHRVQFGVESMLGSVLESVLGRVLESVLGSVLENVLRAYLGVYSQAGWECAIKCNWERP